MYGASCAAHENVRLSRAWNSFKKFSMRFFVPAKVLFLPSGFSLTKLTEIMKILIYHDNYKYWGVKLTTHFSLVPRSENAWSYTSTPQ
jgi:hypothetical protein